MEMYTSESPYSFSGNNPVNNVDPSSDDFSEYYNQYGGTKTTFKEWYEAGGRYWINVDIKDWYENSGDNGTYVKTGTNYTLTNKSTSSGERDTRTPMGSTTFLAGKVVSEFEGRGLYMHYLLKSKILKVYKTPYVNQHTKVVNRFGFKATSVFFMTNQSAMIYDYFSSNGAYKKSDFKNDTYMNIIGTLNLYVGTSMMIISTYGQFSEWWNNSPIVKDFFISLDNGLVKWQADLMHN